jgi:hypothetical protein
MHARETRGRRVPDLTDELVLMAEDIHSSRDKPARRRFTQLVDALEQARARYAIIGAVAMGAHGAERYTQDIDVLVAADDLERVVANLSGTMTEIGREPARGPAKQVRLRSKRARTARAIDVDLLAVDAVEAWALETAVRGRAFDRRVDVASTEAVVLMKLRAYLSDPESDEGLKHKADAMRILRITNVDVPSLRRFVKSHAALAAELERVLAAPPPRGRLG